jgi:hypothetical protein
LDEVILSAPSTYPLPDPRLAWPYGMAPGMRDASGGSVQGGKNPAQLEGALFVPNPTGLA